MARPGTVKRVHAAVMDLAQRCGTAGLTMEGIAAEAGVGKQTLYRTWPSVQAILFDALLAESAEAQEAEAQMPIELVLKATIDELHTEPRASLLRILAASIQTDETVAHQFRTRLFGSQQAQVTRFLAANGFSDPDAAAELLLAPIFYRWFLQLPAFTPEDLHQHIEAVRLLASASSINVPGRQSRTDRGR